MLRLISLLLPALIPSWRFFKAIAPSPRVEWAWAQDGPPQWQAFRPRPQTVSVARMFRRLLWNPRWAQTLYLVSCAERLTATGDDHSYRQITEALDDELAPHAKGRKLMFRLVFVHREAGVVRRTVTFQSDPFPTGAEA